jgi:hypothetical protein
MGHASMHVGRAYVSWWPQGDGREPKVPGSAGRTLPLYSVAHIQGQSFRSDQELEECSPDHTVPLDGLDEPRILAWWKKFDTPGRKWSTLGQNCATTVGRALAIGGGDDYALGAAGWWSSWHTIWQPNDVLCYARRIQHGLAVKRGRHAAINFLRRFASSPVGFTSILTSVDKDGLALALYRESAKSTTLVADVLGELDQRIHGDADGVAEAFVRLLNARQGAPLAAMSRDARLKKLLIKLLGQGRPSDGKRSCIGFVTSLN